MADAGRKDFSTKLSEAVTPDSEKSNYQKVKESVTDTLDKGASKLTPEEDKSLGQSVGDSIQKGHDDAKKSWSESANDMINDGKQAVADAAEYVSSAVTGAKHGAEDATRK